VGQEHITQTLQRALDQGKISHAYLFTGPRGVGKTSIARILAHAINDLPYDDDSAHMDIIEIDAASNRRIDEIRELREKVHVAPTSAKYKVYIIDEVHMLTREAFNALLKTLEEPPAHVVFILATTDAHKLPDTIISRTQRFSFKPVEKQKVVAHLKEIAKQEKIKVSDDALALLAEHGEGSFRDSISLLDQAGNQDQVDLPAVQQLLGIPPDEAVQSLLAATLAGGDSATLMQILTGLYDQGYQAAAIAKRLGGLLRQQLAQGSQPELVLPLLGRLIEVPGSHDPERFLEITLLLSRPATRQPASMPEPAPQKAAPAPAPTKQPEEPAQKPAATPRPAGNAPLDASVWPEVLQMLKQRHNTLYGMVRMAQPDFSEAGNVKLTFAFAFHQKRLNENANRERLADIIKELTGQDVHIEGVHDKNAPAPQMPVSVEPPPDDDLAVISNIFGEAKLLES
ncbi:MAG TPA: DNA polymerase III subunit gamma/tau, partial [Candidatus Saccharimonadales bacterium]